MNNYTLSRTPATLSAAAGILLLGYAAMAIAQAEAMERVVDGGGSTATVRSGDPLDLQFHPTVGANLHEAFPIEASVLLDSATHAFAVRMHSGLENLGAEFAEVVEDDFWDLVLR